MDLRFNTKSKRFLKSFILSPIIFQGNATRGKTFEGMWYRKAGVLIHTIVSFIHSYIAPFIQYLNC